MSLPTNFFIGRGAGGGLAFSADRMPLADLPSPSSFTVNNSSAAGSGGMFVNAAGNYMFLFEGSMVRRYTFGSAHNLSTLGTIASDVWSVPSGKGNRAFTMSADGQKSFTISETPKDLYPWTHNAYLPSGGSNNSHYGISTHGTEAYPHTLRFDSTGTKFIIQWYSGSSKVHSYTTSTPYDYGSSTRISTNTINNDGVRQMAVSDDGTFACYMVPGATTLYSYYMSTPWDVSTLYGFQTRSNFLSGVNVEGCFIADKYLYMAGGNQIRQYAI